MNKTRPEDGEIEHYLLNYYLTLTRVSIYRHSYIYIYIDIEQYNSSVKGDLTTVLCATKQHTNASSQEERGNQSNAPRQTNNLAKRLLQNLTNHRITIFIHTQKKGRFQFRE